jgi:hypothetical protein
MILAAAFLMTASFAQAHGDNQHVLGTVTLIDSQHIVVKTVKGATQSVKVTKETLFKEKGRSKSTEKPAVGDRVVIEATKDKNLLTATEVHFSNAKRVVETATMKQGSVQAH